jgi:purine-nucleoside/S-methyl-5'-thioadenosine phosphorylase / adenosine deaminase
VSEAVLRARTLEAAGAARAVFTTRQGGTSGGPYRSFNLSYAVGDARPAVARNRRLAAAAVGADPRRLVEAQQVHGAGAAVVGPGDAGRIVPAVDALLTDSTAVWLAIHTADCVPVLIVAPDRPAVAAVHAGWRGVAAGVVPAVLGRLRAAFRCDPARCLVALGPSIGGCCYEVDRPVAGAMGGAPWWPRAARRAAPGKWYLDLKQAIREQLTGAGVPANHIDVTPGCTRCQPDLYFSYRRERATGRMAACIRLCE